MSDVQWNGDEAMEMIRKRTMQFVTRAASTVLTRVKELLSAPGTALSIARGQKGKRLQDQVRSKPGEPPRKQTGDLREHYTYEVDEASMSARIGSNQKKAKALELGTTRGLKPRPHLRRALYEMQAKVDELLSQIKE